MTQQPSYDTKTHLITKDTQRYRSISFPTMWQSAGQWKGSVG